MIKGKKIICDCCGRQIVYYKADDKYIIGPRKNGIYYIGMGKHCCFSCYPEYKQFQEIAES